MPTRCIETEIVCRLVYLFAEYAVINREGKKMSNICEIVRRTELDTYGGINEEEQLEALKASSE